MGGHLRIPPRELRAGALLAPAAEVSRMDKKPFGRTSGGQSVELHTLRNAKGLSVSIATLGGIVTSLMLPQ